MKKLFVFNLLLLFFLVGKAEPKEEKWIIDINSKDEAYPRSGEEPILPFAYVQKSTVYVEFAEAGTAYVAIIKADTDACVHAEYYQSSIVAIPLIGEEAGDYRIEIIINGAGYEGDFKL